MAESRHATFHQVHPGAFKLEVDFGDVMRQMNELPDNIRNQLVRGVFKQALRPMMLVAKAKAPIGKTAQLAANIKIRAGKRSSTKISCVISSSGGKSANSGKTYYGYFQEKGFKVLSPKGMVSREVPGKHYMAQAFDETEDMVVKNIEDWLTQGVQAYFQKG